MDEPPSRRRWRDYFRVRRRIMLLLSCGTYGDVWYVMKPHAAWSRERVLVFFAWRLFLLSWGGAAVYSWVFGWVPRTPKPDGLEATSDVSVVRKALSGGRQTCSTLYSSSYSRFSLGFYFLRGGQRGLATKFNVDEVYLAFLLSL